jgi:hypothetical protein
MPNRSKALRARRSTRVTVTTSPASSWSSKRRSCAKSVFARKSQVHSAPISRLLQPSNLVSGMGGLRTCTPDFLHELMTAGVLASLVVPRLPLTRSPPYAGRRRGGQRRRLPETPGARGVPKRLGRAGAVHIAGANVNFGAWRRASLASGKGILKTAREPGAAGESCDNSWPVKAWSERSGDPCGSPAGNRLSKRRDGDVRPT